MPSEKPIKRTRKKTKGLIFQISGSRICVQVENYSQLELLVLQLLTESMTPHQLIEKSAKKIDRGSFFKIMSKWRKMRIIKTENVLVNISGLILTRTFYSRNFKNFSSIEIE